MKFRCPMHVLRWIALAARPHDTSCSVQGSCPIMCTPAPLGRGPLRLKADSQPRPRALMCSRTILFKSGHGLQPWASTCSKFLQHADACSECTCFWCKGSWHCVYDRWLPSTKCRFASVVTRRCCEDTEAHTPYWSECHSVTTHVVEKGKLASIPGRRYIRELPLFATAQGHLIAAIPVESTLPGPRPKLSPSVRTSHLDAGLVLAVLSCC